MSRRSKDFSNIDNTSIGNSNTPENSPKLKNGMPPAAVQVYQNQEGNQGHHQYSHNRNVQYNNGSMDAVDERKNPVMQRPAYQQQSNHQHQYNAHPSSSNRPSHTHSSSVRRSRNSSTSQNSFAARDGRSRHSRDSNSQMRRPTNNSNSVASSGNNNIRASSSQRALVNNMNVNANAGHDTNNNYQYQQSVHAHQHVHPAPPQSNANVNNHYPSPNLNNPHIKQDIPSQSNYPPNPSIPVAQQQQRRPAYLLHRDLVIGKGSYGQVCIASRGEAEGHGRTGGKRKKFACKCVVLRNDPKYIAKLQEEVNVLRELRGHDNVIRLYDVFCVDNELFIITELGRGGDLFHLLTTHPKHGVTEAYAAKTVAQMLSAVAFLHSRNICHRDLKLENWVLESGRDVWSPLKLIDFGLSTHFTPGHRLSRVVGSSYYVAPEVLKKSYSEACDLWSLGVIVYMLLSGAPPFYGRNDEAIKASIVNGEYTFPHELFRDVSDEAMAFVSTLLSYNTEYRYTADQALTHPWLATNCDPEQLRRAKEGSRGSPMTTINDRPEPMQM